jgi:hypothetical protein
MRNVRVWIDDIQIRTFPKLQNNISADVLVVRPGITGITTAYLLKKAGSRVVRTGCTTAHVTYVTDVSLQQLVRNFGKDHAQAAWDVPRDLMHTLGVEESTARQADAWATKNVERARMINAGD